MTPLRIGYGYDSHRFDGARELVLGGVRFPGETGLSGHSDADVLIHAVIDAVLGAAGLGDIGGHFPDTDGRWRGADSAEMLAAVAVELSENGYRTVNVDATVVCECPKIAPRVPEIRKRLASILGVETGAVNVKGKTNEGMDDVGSRVGIAAHAVCLLEKTEEG
jgi:2-C-methyl-D-erythritol 2,4-cyclodiphosphate synthase